MYARRLTLALLLAGLVVPFAVADQVDGSYQETRAFTLKPERGGGFSLVCDVEVAYAYRSERSTRERIFFVPEPFYASVSKLKADLSGERLGRDRIGVQVPEFEDVFMASGRVHYLQFPDDAQPGDVARYSYRESYLAPAFMPLLSVPNYGHVSTYEVSIKHPAGVDVEFSFFFPREALEPEIDRSRRGETVLRFRDLDRTDVLPYFPFNDIHAEVMVQMTWGGVPVTPTSAESFATWYRDLVGSLEGAGLGALAASLEGGTPREQVEAIHDYVRSSIRYVADERAESAIVPRDPSTVLSNGYGDCKDRAFLVAALARELGVDVAVVLVSTDPRAEFDGVHVGLFDHVIALFEDEAGPVFFDPTHRHVAFGDLPESDIEAAALVVSGAEPRSLRIPAHATEPLLDVSVTGSLEEPQAARAEVTLRGDYLAEVNRLQAEGSALDLENFLSIAATGQLHKISLDHFEFLGGDRHAATFAAEADLSEFVVASPTRRYLPRTPFRTVDPVVMKRAEDGHPVYLSLIHI